MIARIWEGRTAAEQAGAYERFLLDEFIPGIIAKKIPGFRHFQLLKRTMGDETAFMTIMWFDDLSQIKAFAGENYEQAVIDPRAMALLSTHDEISRHFELAGEIRTG